MRSIKPLAVTLALACALVATAASAAPVAPVKGKVVGIDKKRVKVVVAEKLPAWAKKGVNVRFLEIKSLIVAISADTVTISSPNAAKAKVGADVTIEKPKAGLAGC